MITAVYSGGNYGGGTFNMTPNQVVANPLIGALSSNSNSSAPNTPVTFTWTDTVPTGDAPASGTITFFDNGSQIGTPQSLIGDTASITTSSLAIGVHNITATYTPLSPFNPFYAVTTATLAPKQVVGTAPSMLLSSDLSPAAPGAIVTFHFTATGITGNAVPTGKVQFFDGTTPIGIAQNLILGSASISTNSLSSGTHTITAQYSGDGNYAGGTALLIPDQVINDAPAIQITTSANPASDTSPVTITAHITRGTGDPITTGTVTFFDGATQIGIPQTISAGGTAQVSVTLFAGTHSITAVYSGDVNYEKESTTFANLVVQDPPLPPISPPPTVAAAASPNLQVNAVISGGAGAGITKTGVGQLILNNVNTYSGPTIETGALGSIVLGVNNALPTGTSATITAGTLNVNGTTGTIASLTGAAAGTLALGGGAFTIGTDNSSTTFAGPITGTGTLTKQGTGTFKLTGDSPTYTGTTVIASGTVLFDANDGSSAVRVLSGGTLGGTNGTVGSVVNVAAGGTVAPGSSPGILNSNGPVAFSAGSAFSVEINGPTVGTQYDRLNVTGAVNLGGATLVVSTNYLATNGNPPLNQLFVILTSTGGFGTSLLSDLSGHLIAEGGRYVSNSRVYDVSYAGNDVTLKFVGFDAVGTVTANVNPASPGQGVNAHGCIHLRGRNTGPEP